jgi:phage repressor protein C with HTH and peptisase S24 domain
VKLLSEKRQELYLKLGLYRRNQEHQQMSYLLPPVNECPKFSFLNHSSKGFLNTDCLDFCNMSIGERIKNRMNELGLRPKDVIQKTGVSKGAVSQWASDAVSPKGENLMNLARALRCKPEWLQFGTGSPEEATLGLNTAGLGEQTNQFAEVLYYDIEFSAGHGMNGQGNAEAKTYLIPLDDLQDLGMTADDGLVCKVKGESMYPYFHDKDLVLINRTVTRPTSNKVFAFRFDDDLLIKRFSKELDGSWVISGDNADKSQYRDFKATPSLLADIGIIGQVVSLVRRNIA